MAHVADALSLSRLVLGALAWPLAGNPLAIVALMGLAGLSDVADGWFARRKPAASSDAGVWLDPLCDKVFVLSVAAAVVAWGGVDILALALVATRELLLAPFIVASLSMPRARRARLNWRAAPIGKATTFVQLVALVALVLHGEIGQGLAIIAAALGLVAAAYYLLRARAALNP